MESATKRQAMWRIDTLSISNSRGESAETYHLSFFDPEGKIFEAFCLKKPVEGNQRSWRTNGT